MIYFSWKLSLKFYSYSKTW